EIELIDRQEMSAGVFSRKRKSASTIHGNGRFVDDVQVRGDASGVGQTLFPPNANEPQQVSFEVSGKTNIPSDGQNHEIQLKSVSHPARFVHWAAPMVRPEVYLTAEMEN